ncbi:MAG TPA: hypothetical protein VM884_08640 [Flavisolibacter sp.]|jgi:hypothetical protein|nr:hypothetical protein [Flavisolibacter sp.]
MKNSVIADSFNKIAILVLLSGSLVYHVKECFRAKEASTQLFNKSLSISTADFTNHSLPSSTFSYLFLSNKNFIKP